MPKFQELKTDPKCFELSLAGVRPWEIRFNDRGYEEGDVLRLRETRYTGAEMKNQDVYPLEYTGRELIGIVQNVFSGPQYGLKVGWVILTVHLLIKSDFNAVERAKGGQG